MLDLIKCFHTEYRRLLTSVFVFNLLSWSAVINCDAARTYSIAVAWWRYGMYTLRVLWLIVLVERLDLRWFFVVAESVGVLVRGRITSRCELLLQNLALGFNALTCSG